MLRVVVHLAVCCVIVQCAQNKGDAAYLDSNELYHLDWTFTDKEITFTVTANTTGWFGLGWSANGGMEAADIIIGWVEDGVAHVQDRYATRNGLPVMDDSQDVKLIEGSETNGQTKIKFSRKLVTCDEKDRPIMTDTMRMIWAMSRDNQDPADKDPVYHAANRGTRSMYLLTEIPPADDIPSDAFTFDFKNENVLIPNTDTMYWCEVRKAPVLNGTKHHIIKMEPIIEKQNLGIVHHIIVYACFDDDDREHYFNTSNATGHNCFNANMPSDLQKCRAPIVIWAIGGQEIHFPEEAGYPLGDAESPNYFLIETHYDNPQLLSGRRDSSGMRITLTPSLRKYDSGVIEAGAVHGIAIPPKQEDFVASFFCSSNCTKKSLTEDVKLFSVVLHAHLAGRKVIARHFRDGKDLGVLSSDLHYDFNYQQSRLLQNPVVMKQGDGIMTTCHYNTMDRTEMTYGGLPSSSEMCLVFLSYYPRQNLSNCETTPIWMYDVTTYTGLTFQYNNSANEGFETVMNKINWTQANNVKLQEDNYVMWPQLEKCTGLNSQPHIPYDSLYNFPDKSKKPSVAEDPNANCNVKDNSFNSASSVVLNIITYMIACAAWLAV